MVRTGNRLDAATTNGQRGVWWKEGGSVNHFVVWTEYGWMADNSSNQFMEYLYSSQSADRARWSLNPKHWEYRLINYAPGEE